MSLLKKACRQLGLYWECVELTVSDDGPPIDYTDEEASHYEPSCALMSLDVDSKGQSCSFMRLVDLTISFASSSSPNPLSDSTISS